MPRAGRTCRGARAASQGSCGARTLQVCAVGVRLSLRDGPCERERAPHAAHGPCGRTCRSTAASTADAATASTPRPSGSASPSSRPTARAPASRSAGACIALSACGRQSGCSLGSGARGSKCAVRCRARGWRRLGGSWSAGGAESRHDISTAHGAAPSQAQLQGRPRSEALRSHALVLEAEVLTLVEAERLRVPLDRLSHRRRPAEEEQGVVTWGGKVSGDELGRDEASAA